MKDETKWLMAEQVPEIRVPIPPQIEIIFFFAKRKVDNSQWGRNEIFLGEDLFNKNFEITNF